MRRIDRLMIITPAKRLVSVKDAMRRIGCGRTHFYSLLNSSQLEAVKLSRRTYVVEDALDDFIEKLPKYQPSTTHPAIGKAQTTPLECENVDD